MNLHERFLQLGCQKNSLTRELCSLLPEIDRQRIHEKHGYSSIYEYAWTLAGLSVSMVKKALNLDRKLEGKPELKKMIITEGIHKVDMVANLATPETETMWAKKVSSMSKAGLQQLSKEVRGTHRKELRIMMDEETERLFLKLKKALGGSLSNQQALRKLLKKLDEPKKEVKARNISPGRSRHIPAAIKRKAGDSCVYPSCKKPRDNFHHRERWADGGSHESVVALCKVHHEFAHNGLISREQKEPNQWKLNLKGEGSWADQLSQEFRFASS